MLLREQLLAAGLEPLQVFSLSLVVSHSLSRVHAHAHAQLAAISAMARRALVAGVAVFVAATSTPPCHAPWGNEQALESPCYDAIYLQGDVAVRQYSPRGAGYQQAFIEATFPGAGDPTAYASHLNEAVAKQLWYFAGNNSAHAAIIRTSPILGRPNVSSSFYVYDWMLPTTVYPKPARAPAPPASFHMQVRPSTLRNLVAALHFTVTGVPGPGDFDQACDTLLPLLPAMGFEPAFALWSPTYAYYTTRGFDGQHDGECLIEVRKV